MLPFLRAVKYLVSSPLIRSTFLGLTFLSGALLGVVYYPSVLYGPPEYIGRYAIYDHGHTSPLLPKRLAEADTLLAKAGLSTTRPVNIFRCSTRFICAVLFVGPTREAGIFIPARNGISISDILPEDAPLFSHNHSPFARLIAHEVAHQSLYLRLGHWRFLQLPLWLQEGYAGHVAYSDQASLSRLKIGWYERRDYFATRTVVTMLLNKSHISLGRLVNNPPSWPVALKAAESIIDPPRRLTEAPPASGPNFSFLALSFFKAYGQTNNLSWPPEDQDVP